MDNSERGIIKDYRFDSILVRTLELDARRVYMSEKSFVKSILTDRMNIDQTPAAFFDLIPNSRTRVPAAAIRPCKTDQMPIFPKLGTLEYSCMSVLSNQLPTFA
jgi:hypothetical protein